MTGSLLDFTAELALDAARSIAGRLVEYTRGSTTLRFEAIPGGTSMDVVDDGLVVDQAELRTYRFPLVELAALDPPHPGEGDYIEEADDDDDAVTHYRYLLTPGPGQDCWQWSDRDRKWCKAFTRQVYRS